MPSKSYGPYAGFQADEEAQSAGFSIASRDFVIAAPADIEDVVEEDATVWVGLDHDERRMLVVEIPTSDERAFPGAIDFSDILGFEKQWTWPTWYESTSIAVPVPVGMTVAGRHDAINLLRSPTGGFELIRRQEMLGIGRSGRAGIEVYEPIRPKSLDAAIAAVIFGKPLQ